MKTKVCRRCKEEKELDEFYRSKYRLYGRQNICKKCNAEYNTKWRKKRKGTEKEISFKQQKKNEAHYYHYFTGRI